MRSEKPHHRLRLASPSRSLPTEPCVPVGQDRHVQRARRAVRSICCTNYVVHDEAELPMRLDEKCAINLNILVGGSNVAWRQLKEKEEAIQLTAAIRPGALRQLIGWSHALVNRKRRMPRGRRSTSISPFARRPGFPDSRESSLKVAWKNRRKVRIYPRFSKAPHWPPVRCRQWLAGFYVGYPGSLTLCGSGGMRGKSMR